MRISIAYLFQTLVNDLSGVDIYFLLEFPASRKYPTGRCGSGTGSESEMGRKSGVVLYDGTVR